MTQPWRLKGEGEASASTGSTACGRTRCHTAPPLLPVAPRGPCTWFTVCKGREGGRWSQAETTSPHSRRGPRLVLPTLAGTGRQPFLQGRAGGGSKAGATERHASPCPAASETGRPSCRRGSGRKAIWMVSQRGALGAGLGGQGKREGRREGLRADTAARVRLRPRRRPRGPGELEPCLPLLQTFPVSSTVWGTPCRRGPSMILQAGAGDLCHYCTP